LQLADPAYQVVANAVLSAGSYALFGLSFASVYRVRRFFDVTPAAAAVTAAYVAYWLSTCWQAPLTLVLVGSSAGAVAFTVVASRLQQSAVFRRRDPAEQFLVSLGIVIVVQSAVALIAGDDTKVMPWPSTKCDLRLVSLTRIQLLLCAIAVAVLAGAAVVLRLTPWGRLYRAVGCDADLAHVVGVRADRVVCAASMASALIAAAAGVLLGADVGITPSIGFRGILFGVIVVIIGGPQSLLGVGLAALLLAAAQQSVVWFVGSRWQDTIAFGILLLSLLVRPQGLLGRPMRKIAV